MPCPLALSGWVTVLPAAFFRRPTLRPNRQAAVVPAETETRRKCVLHFELSGGVGNKIEVAVRVWSLVIDRGRNDAVTNSQRDRDQLDGAAGRA